MTYVGAKFLTRHCSVLGDTLGSFRSENGNDNFEDIAMKWFSPELVAVLKPSLEREFIRFLVVLQRERQTLVFCRTD